VVFAFELERRRETRRRSERHVGALEMIGDEIKKNVELCNQIKNDFEIAGMGYQQYHTITRSTWEAVSDALYDLEDRKLTQRIAIQYYEYDHMQRKMDTRLNLWSMISLDNPLTEMKYEVISPAVKEGAESLAASGSKLLEEINEAIKNLRDC
jgi:hypothetical protein